MQPTCETCNRGPADGVDLYRANAKGQPAVWRCREHVRSEPDPELERIVETVSNSQPDVLAPDGYQWCPRTGILERIN